MQGKVEPAVRILCVDYIVALRRFMIAFNALRSDRHASQRDSVGFEGPLSVEQGHCAGRFHNDDLVG